MHEYGHHVQYEMNIIDFSRGDITYTSHTANENLAERYSSQDYGTRLVWAESWPTVFGILAQHYYSSYLSNIDTACDVLLGEACELSIMAVLWDLYDSDNDTRENIAFGYEDF